MLPSQNLRILLVRRFVGEGGRKPIPGHGKDFLFLRMTNEQIFEILRKNGFTRIVESGGKIILDKGHGEEAKIHYLESCVDLLSMEQDRLATEQYQISNNHFWQHQSRHTERGWGIVYKADDELTREEKHQKLMRMDAVERRGEELKELRAAYGHLHGRVLVGKIILPVDLLGESEPRPAKAIRKRRTVVELEIITPKIAEAFSEIQDGEGLSVRATFQKLENESKERLGEFLTAGQLRGLLQRGKKYL